MVRETLPFTFSMIVALVLITYFPQFVLWVPRLASYKG
jgi:TRAP-type C4-dicarboxylate transport system permease large subunit